MIHSHQNKYIINLYNFKVPILATIYVKGLLCRRLRQAAAESSNIMCVAVAFVSIINVKGQLGGKTESYFAKQVFSK